MHPVNPVLTLPLAATLAMAPSSWAAGFQTTTMPQVPDPIGFAGAFAGIHRGHLVAAGGANFPDGVMPWNGGKKVWHTRVFALDLNNPAASWKPAGSLPGPNGYGLSLTTAEGILIIGGGDENRHFNEVGLMTLDDQGKAAFRPLPALPGPLAQMCGALVGRVVHLCGGIASPTATQALADHWTLDLDAPAKGWTSAPPLPAAGRILATAGTCGAEFIVAGGCSLAPDAAGKPTRTYLRDAWRFSQGAWARLEDLPRPAVAAASPAPSREGELFIVSGDDGAQTGLASPSDHKGFTPEVLRFEMKTGRWSPCGNLTDPPPVTLPAVAWKDGFILFNGEVRPGVRTPQVLLFTPAQP